MVRILHFLRHFDQEFWIAVEMMRAVRIVVADHASMVDDQEIVTNSVSVPRSSRSICTPSAPFASSGAIPFASQ
jgi:hypothetical protein